MSSVRVNISVPRELYERMKKRDEKIKTNWSRVAREAFAVEVNDASPLMIEKIEARLKELNIGLMVSVQLDEQRALSYRRSSGQWGLYVSHANGWMPLAYASRQTRNAALQKMVELIDELKSATESGIERIRVAKEKFLEGMAKE